MNKILFILLFLLLPFSFCIADEAISPPAKVQVTEPSILKKVNEKLFAVLFFDLAFGQLQIQKVDQSGIPVFDESGKPENRTVKIPFIVALLFFGALFFTFWYNFINFRGFKHAIDVVAGKYDNPNETGEVTHFRALTSALSATVGLGNIAGVAVAIQLGGPGAVFWMIVSAFFGMSSKFSCCTLAQLYRRVNADGSISGGPMYYIDIGFKKMGGLWAPFGKFLAVLFAFMVMGGSVGGGNMFQANQTAEAFRSTFGWGSESDWYVGIALSVLVASVILGGIKRIGAVTSYLVPVMCGIYVLASLYIIFSNAAQIPNSISTIFSLAFNNNAAFGGIVGVMVVGIQRAAFSNEAGLGSAAIVHAAAKTEEPVREGIVGLLEPFIDTIIICFMTGLVVVITGVWSHPELASQGSNIGVTLTNAAFSSVIPWFPYVLTLCICLFAYSTMISWCYYGERGWIYLLDHFNGSGLKTVFIFRIAFVAAILVGAVNSLSDVIDFTDAMILSMALPNILAMIILAPSVKPIVDDYMKRLSSGKFSRPTS